MKAMVDSISPEPADSREHERGVIAATLRSMLRDLAEADARLYRGLAEELATPAPRPALPDGDIAAAIELLKRHGYTVTPPEG